MIQQTDKFFSYIESRIQEKGQLYAHFHLGTFCAGQALTVANALRRTLLAEIPGIIVTSVEIEGANHEFATLPGVQENVLNILLNIKQMVLTAKKSDIEKIARQRQELIASLNVSGPAQIKAQDIKFPAGVTPVSLDHPIATLGSTGNLKLNLGIQFIDPLLKKESDLSISQLDTKKIFLNTIPNPVRQVNYSIRQFEAELGKEYISLEIWTDGSVDPKNALDCAFERLTQMFYQFTILNKNVMNPSASQRQESSF